MGPTCLTCDRCGSVSGPPGFAHAWACVGCRAEMAGISKARAIAMTATDGRRSRVGVGTVAPPWAATSPHCCNA